MGDKNITLKEAMFELEKNRIVKDSDSLLNAAMQELMKCENLISLLLTARGPGQIKKNIKHLVIGKALSQEGCSASLKEVLSYLDISYKYHGIYDEIRTFLNSLVDAGLIDKFIVANGKFIYASKATDKQVIERILKEEDVKEEDFDDWFEKITKGTGEVQTCDHTDKRGKVCGAGIKSRRDASDLGWGRKVWYYTCYSGHRGVIDFEPRKHYYEEKRGGRISV